jgi:hypothetical protein
MLARRTCGANADQIETTAGGSAGGNTRFARRNLLGLNFRILQPNVADRAHRKETISARHAAIRRDSRHSEKPGTPSTHVLLGDELKIEIATFATVRVKQKRQRD